MQDEFLANEDIRAGHHAIVAVIEALLTRAQEIGALRPDVKALDVLMLLKGVCETAVQFQDLDPQISSATWIWSTRRSLRRLLRRRCAGAARR